MSDLSSGTWSLIIILLVTGLILVPMLSRRVRDRISRHTFSFQTAAQLAATFLGVVLAIWFADWQKRNDERRQAIEILDRMIANTHDRFEDLLADRVGAANFIGADLSRRDRMASFAMPNIVLAWSKSETVLRYVSVDFALLLSGIEKTILNPLLDPEASADEAIEGTLRSLSQLKLMLAIEKYHLTGVFSDEVHRFLFVCVFNPRTAVQSAQHLVSCIDNPDTLNRPQSRSAQQAIADIHKMVADYRLRVLGESPQNAPLRSPAEKDPAGGAKPK